MSHESPARNVELHQIPRKLEMPIILDRSRIQTSCFVFNLYTKFYKGVCPVAKPPLLPLSLGPLHDQQRAVRSLDLFLRISSAVGNIPHFREVDPQELSHHMICHHKYNILQQLTDVV